MEVLCWFCFVCMTHTVTKFQQKQNLGRRFGASKMHLSPPPPTPGGLGLGCGSVVINQLFNVLSVVCGSSVFVFVLLCITFCPFQFCNHFYEKEKADYFAFIVFWMSCYCKCSWLFLTVSWVGLQCVIVAFPDHTHLH